MAHHLHESRPAEERVRETSRTEPEPRLARGTGAHARPSQDGLRAVEVAQIVHDLRTPLATIALEAYLLEAKLDRGDEARAGLVRITRNVEFLDRMIADLLDSCAFEEGKLCVQPAQVELRAMIERVIERSVPARDRERVTMDAPDLVSVIADELRVERVLANLLGNALKYAQRGPIEIRLEHSRWFARLWVIDAGPGMTSTEMAYVFDKYRRTSGARDLAGHGLGLYVSKKIIEMHGGRIGVESVRGHGSRFFFELPIALSR